MHYYALHLHLKLPNWIFFPYTLYIHFEGIISNNKCQKDMKKISVLKGIACEVPAIQFIELLHSQQGSIQYLCQGGGQEVLLWMKNFFDTPPRTYKLR